MTTTKLETVKIGGWTGKPSKIGDGYDLYDSRNEYRGYCPASQIVEHLKEMSGENYRALPVVKRDQIKCVAGEKIKNGIAGQWYRHDVYSYNGKEIGRVQVRNRYYGKKIGSRIDTLSITENHGVQGFNLRWICEQSGLRLEE